jgi:serine/threonine protein kinase
MHEKRIMHRDLKPANIFIAADDTLKIGDLGLGREFSSGTIEAYSKVGTPLYMSPEVKNYYNYLFLFFILNSF